MVPETPGGNLYPLRSPPRGAAESCWWNRGLPVSVPSLPSGAGQGTTTLQNPSALQSLRAFFSSAAILHQSRILEPTQT